MGGPQGNYQWKRFDVCLFCEPITMERNLWGIYQFQGIGVKVTEPAANIHRLFLLSLVANRFLLSLKSFILLKANQSVLTIIKVETLIWKNNFPLVCLCRMKPVNFFVTIDPYYPHIFSFLKTEAFFHGNRYDVHSTD